VATTAVNVLQAALLLFALWTFALRARVVLFEARLDRKAFLTELRAALEAEQHEQARRLAEGCLPAWPARIALTGLHAIAARRSVQAAVEEERAELLHRAPLGIATLRALARMAPPLAFIGVVCELGRALGGGYGLAALQRGLPERLALERSLVTFAIGVGTCLFAISAARTLSRAAADLTSTMADVASALDRVVVDADRARM
jgi:hypothetical protein